MFMVMVMMVVMVFMVMSYIEGVDGHHLYNALRGKESIPECHLRMCSGKQENVEKLDFSDGKQEFLHIK